MDRLASRVGRESPLPPPVRPSAYDTITRITSLSPSIAIAKYGPLSRRHGQPMISASTAPAAPPPRQATGHGRPALTRRPQAKAPVPKNPTGPQGTQPVSP